MSIHILHLQEFSAVNVKGATSKG